MQKSPNLNQAVDILKKDGVIIFPTDTVWGIGASINSPVGIKKLYQIKNRPLQQPTAVLVKDLTQAKEYGQLNQPAIQLVQQYWPGALTIIVPATKAVPSLITGKDRSIGIRSPNFSLVSQLCTQLDAGIVAASANRKGLPPPGSRGEVDDELIKETDMMLEGESESQPASTVVKVSPNQINIVRHGSIKIQI